MLCHGRTDFYPCATALYNVLAYPLVFLSPIENELAKKHEEVGECQARYHSAELKKLEALSYINEQELKRNHTEPRMEAGREREDLRTQNRMVKKQTYQVRPTLWSQLTITQGLLHCINFLSYLCQGIGGSLPE